ncbi:type IV secretion system protein [Neorickettsia sp. 179522]|uniref:type IV secretion system protein n=1 Tax=Neorickettsia sp. 179522 TaxID=1714371 RepID=UPI0007965100|nr:type IV secretion system protein [Neorickettsia sp. 179522]KYH12792.1 type IV secretion system protein VirB6 [Neorickettsia sp. 179522]
MKKIRVVEVSSAIARYCPNALKRVFILILGLFLLSGCEKCENACPRCIAADDFGIPKSSASALIERASILLKSDAEMLGLESNTAGKQIMRWEDSGYVTSGEPITLNVEGRWLFIPVRSALNFSKDEMQKVFRCGDIDYEALKGASEEFRRNFPHQSCTYLPTQMTDITTGCLINGVKIDPKFSQSGCILEKGYGLYLLFHRPGDPNPNATFASIATPSSPTMHVAYSGDDIRIESIFTSDCTHLKLKPGWRIYYKLMDVFYQNNIGGYSLEFRTGVVDPKNTAKFFEGVRSTLQKLLTGQNEVIYKAITSNNDYVSLVKALIVLMIVLTGLRFLMGMSDSPPSELLIKVLKMAVILQLISPSSWDFFYNNLFRLFIDGLNEVIAVVNSHTGAGYQPDQPFAFLDDTVNLLFKMLVSTKVKAILLAYPLGVFWWLILFFILVIYVVLVAYAFVVYLTALVGISVLIVLMPILFLGMLFGQLKHTFDNWFTQALSFCFQAIMIFTVVSLFSAMIKDQFYRNTGYTVCCNKFWIFPFNVSVYAWTPGQRFLPLTMDHMWDSKRVEFTGGAKVIDIPPHYEKKGCRFVDYPFYDPQISDVNCGVAGFAGKGGDWERIEQIRESDSGLLDMAEVFVLLLLSVIMFHMRDLCQSIGASLVGASPFQAVIGGAYAAQDGIGGLYRAGKMMVGALADKLPVLSRVRSGINDIASLRGYIGEKVAAKLNETNLGETTMKVLSTVGDVSSGVIKGTSYLLGVNSELSDHYYEKKAFRQIHYTQALMGYHLVSIVGTRDLSDSPGIRMLFGGLKHMSDKYFVGEKEESLFGGLRKLYVCEREKIHDYYLGIQREKLPEYTSDTKEHKDLDAHFSASAEGGPSMNESSEASENLPRHPNSLPPSYSEIEFENTASDISLETPGSVSTGEASPELTSRTIVEETSSAPMGEESSTSDISRELSQDTSASEASLESASHSDVQPDTAQGPDKVETASAFSNTTQDTAGVFSVVKNVLDKQSAYEDPMRSVIPGEEEAKKSRRKRKGRKLPGQVTETEEETSD